MKKIPTRVHRVDRPSGVGQNRLVGWEPQSDLPKKMG